VGDDGVVPLICPTCQIFAGSLKASAALLLCMGLFSISCLEAPFTLQLPSVDDRRVACRAVARGQRGPPSPLASARQPSLASRAKAGGPGRTRTCNQTVMSGRIVDALVDFLAPSFELDRVRCYSFTRFLVRNWCAPGLCRGGRARLAHQPRKRLSPSEALHVCLVADAVDPRGLPAAPREAD
jgi:hypothetical protein